MPEYQCCKLNANVVMFNWITNTAVISQFLCSRKSDPTKKGLNSCETNQFSIFESNYTMAGKQAIRTSTGNKHLRVLLSKDLSWNSHIFAVVAKSNRLLGLLKRTFGKRSTALLVDYKVTVCLTCDKAQLSIALMFSYVGARYNRHPFG